MSHLTPLANRHFAIMTNFSISHVWPDYWFLTLRLFWFWISITFAIQLYSNCPYLQKVIWNLKTTWVTPNLFSPHEDEGYCFSSSRFSVWIFSCNWSFRASISLLSLELCGTQIVIYFFLFYYIQLVSIPGDLNLTS